MPRQIARLAQIVRDECQSIETLPAEQRRAQIKLALIETGAADPDDRATVAAIEAAILHPEPVLPRVKAFTGLPDRELAELVKKSRPTVQAYLSGRLTENLTPDAYARLADAVHERMQEVDMLLAELRPASAP